MCVIRRHFLACEDIAGGSDLSAGEHFFREIQRPFLWVLAVSRRNHYFARNKEAFPCVWPWTQLSASPRTVHFRWMSFIEHVNQAAREHQGEGRQRGLGRERHGAREYSVVVSHVEEYEGLLGVKSRD